MSIYATLWTLRFPATGSATRCAATAPRVILQVLRPDGSVRILREGDLPPHD